MRSRLDTRRPTKTRCFNTGGPCDIPSFQRRSIWRSEISRNANRVAATLKLKEQGIDRLVAQHNLFRPCSFVPQQANRSLKRTTHFGGESCANHGANLPVRRKINLRMKPFISVSGMRTVD